MNRILSYRFAVSGQDPATLLAKITDLVSCRSGKHKYILGVDGEQFPDRVMIYLRVAGFDRWRITQRGATEIETVARWLRMPQGSVELVGVAAETSLCDLSRDEGRPWRSPTAAERRVRRQARWEQFVKGSQHGQDSDSGDADEPAHAGTRVGDGDRRPD